MKLVLYRNARRAEKITAKFKNINGVLKCVKIDFGEIYMENKDGMKINF